MSFCTSCKAPDPTGDRGLVCEMCQAGEPRILYCNHCAGQLGPDVTGRPMCYGCGPQDMRPRDAEIRLLHGVELRADARTPRGRALLTQRGSVAYIHPEDAEAPGRLVGVFIRDAWGRIATPKDQAEIDSRAFVAKLAAEELRLDYALMNGGGNG